jgi:hypothetical protein
MSAVPLRLPAQLITACVRVITRYTNVASNDVTLDLVELREVQLDDIVRRAGAAPGVWASLTIEPERARFGIALEASFAVSIIDRSWTVMERCPKTRDLCLLSNRQSSSSCC